MLSLALIGKDIKHSKSQQMYEELLNSKIQYALVDCSSEVEIPSIEVLFKKYDGVSITSPYKKHFLKDVILEEKIKKLGCINCLGRFEGKIHGTNTDYLAISEYLKGLITTYKNGLDVIILGDGSMSSITIQALEEQSIGYQVLSRKKNGDLSSLDLSQFLKNPQSQSLIINSCSRGFVFNGAIDSSTIFWDYNYSFEPHYYLKSICNYIDGLTMLKAQARFALKFWSSKTIK